MLIESGARSEFKAQVLAFCTSAPLPGEQYLVDDAAKILNSNGPMGPVTVTVTHICGDVHFQTDHGNGDGRHCVVFGHKWRMWRESGILKFVGFASGTFWL